MLGSNLDLRQTESAIAKENKATLEYRSGNSIKNGISSQLSRIFLKPTRAYLELKLTSQGAREQSCDKRPLREFFEERNQLLDMFSISGRI